MSLVRRLVWVGAVGAALALAAALLSMLGQRPVPWPNVLYLLTVPIPFMAVGIHLIWRRAEQRVGWLMVTGTALTTGFAAPLEWLIKTRFGEHGLESWMAPVLVVEALVAMVGLACFAILIGLFPSGTPVTPGQRRFAKAMWWLPLPMLGGLLANREVLVESVGYQGLPALPNPIHVEALAGIGAVTGSVREILYAAILAGFALLLMRWRHESPARRLQIRWVLIGIGAAFFIGVIPILLRPLLGADTLIHGGMLLSISALALPMIPLSVLVALEQPVWLDQDTVIRKSFIYGALSIGLFVVYAGVAALLGRASGRGLPIMLAILITATLALGFQPARGRLRSIADRWVFDEPTEPLEVVTELEGPSRSEDETEEEIGEHFAHLVRAAARLRWVAVSIQPGVEGVAGKVSAEAALSIPVSSQGRQIGEIRCGPKLTGSLTVEDIRLITALGQQAALLAANRNLAGRIVQVQEVEKRRLERNLHDGAQQELVALVAKLGLARTQAKRGVLDDAVLLELQRDAQTILRDLRDLAQGIHPSVLTDGGLVEAVEDRCSRLPIDTHVAASPGLRAQRFDDDIEGAAFFFVAESLANVLKHSGASEAHVVLNRRGRDLELTIADNGVGFDPTRIGQNGLAGLHDRFTALAGSLNVETSPGAGTVISARLPLKAGDS